MCFNEHFCLSVFLKMLHLTSKLTYDSAERDAVAYIA